MNWKDQNTPVRLSPRFHYQEIRFNEVKGPKCPYIYFLKKFETANHTEPIARFSHVYFFQNLKF